jgi:hypothetical protein
MRALKYIARDIKKYGSELNNSAYSAIAGMTNLEDANDRSCGCQPTGRELINKFKRSVTDGFSSAYPELVEELYSHLN